MECFMFQKRQVTKKHTIFGQEGVATKRFFLTCVLQNVKSYLFWGAIFWQILVYVQKHYKNRYFSTIFKAKKAKTGPFLMVIISWSK